MCPPRSRKSPHAADVAVETVYARFRNKANLLVAVKDAAVTEGGEIPLPQRPELASLAAETDQHRQLQIAAALSRGISSGYHPCTRCCGTQPQPTTPSARPSPPRSTAAAGSSEPSSTSSAPAGPSVKSLTADQAADTYSALANPDLYLLMTIHHGWTADRFQAWLASSLQRLLLPDP